MSRVRMVTVVASSIGALVAVGAVYRFAPSGQPEAVALYLDEQREERERLDDLYTSEYGMGTRFELTGFAPFEPESEQYQRTYLVRLGWKGTLSFMVDEARYYVTALEAGTSPDTQWSAEHAEQVRYVVVDLEITNIDAEATGKISTGEQAPDGWIRPTFSLVQNDPLVVATYLGHDASPDGASEYDALYMDLPKGQTRQVRIWFELSWLSPEDVPRELPCTLYISDPQAEGRCSVDCGTLRLQESADVERAERARKS
ncbi:hypothetical protein [Collinsella ihumii]|uniref:hypothetical protein n=1 Tax=Collinsella ihumii TaxID=1720204 RepID=UPI0025AA8CA4|nr:hypothetical protein [Collinsella ihumii]MDN0055791.1 hypothetical protein [Collinsella ihumii]